MGRVIGLFLLRVSDLKQYFYCPRIIYFTYVLPVDKKVTAKMEEGALAHLETVRLEHRRGLRAYRLDEGQRYFHTFLASERLGLQGVLDMHLVTPAGCFPVEFKNTGHHRLAVNHKYQLTAYALLLEDYCGRPVRGGFVYFIPRKTACYVEVTPRMRLFVKEKIGKIRTLIANQIFPEAPRRRGRCVDCEYKNFCGDVG